MKYRISFIAIIVLAIGLFAINRMETAYVQQVYASAFEFKKAYLRDTTVNFVADIATTKTDSVTVFEFTVDMSLKELTRAVENRKTAVQAVKQYFETRSDPSMWSAVLVDSDTGELLFSHGVRPDEWNGDVTAFYGILCSYRVITSDAQSLTLVYGISNAHLEKTVQGIFVGKVHNYKFTDGAYIFIYKILNHEGGDNYAIRFAHPDQNALENMYVSTKGGVSGKYWYRNMLDGINTDGEYFGEYDFTDPTTGVVTPRLSYSCWFEPYDWIITMTTNRDMLTDYIDSSVAMSTLMYFRKLLPFGVILILVLIVLLFLQMILDKRKLQKETEYLSDCVNWDDLTHANTRQFGADELDHVFRNYKSGFQSPAIMLLDVDNFKGVNDTYGHDAGDEVLKQIVATVYHNCRASDKLIRWGGDEFVGIFDGMKLDYCTSFANKLLEAVSKIPFEFDGKEVSVTVSLGFAYFRPEDTTYKAALNRADQALYQSKAKGKNQGRVL